MLLKVYHGLLSFINLFREAVATNEEQIVQENEILPSNLPDNLPLLNLLLSSEEISSSENQPNSDESKDTRDCDSISGDSDFFWYSKYDISDSCTSSIFSCPERDFYRFDCEMFLINFFEVEYYEIVATDEEGLVMEDFKIVYISDCRYPLKNTFQETNISYFKDLQDCLKLSIVFNINHTVIDRTFKLVYLDSHGRKISLRTLRLVRESLEVEFIDLERNSNEFVSLRFFRDLSGNLVPCLKRNFVNLPNKKIIWREESQMNTKQLLNLYIDDLETSYIQTNKGKYNFTFDRSRYYESDKPEYLLHNEYLKSIFENHKDSEFNKPGTNENSQILDLKRPIENSLDANENSLDAIENSLDAIENSLDANENSLDANENSLDANENSLDANENSLDDNENSLDANENSLDDNDFYESNIPKKEKRFCRGAYTETHISMISYLISSPVTMFQCKLFKDKV
ncbi:hypothetical protein NGRA_1949, partial [Nosema granulosis]